MTVGAQRATRSLSTANRAAGAARRRVPLPRTWGLRASDAYFLVALNGLLILAMWIRHGNLSEFGTPAGTYIALGQLLALYGTYTSLIQLLLVSRSPYFDEVFGTDRMMWMHRWLGFATVWLLAGHLLFTTIGYSMTDGSGILGQIASFVLSYPYVLLATISAGLFATIALTSIKAARQKASYETWYGIHLYVYLAVALGFMHQLVVGTDFINDPIARLYWIGLYALSVGSLVVFRFAQPIWISLRHRLYVANVVREAPGVVSIYVAGRDLDRLAVQAGQWFRFRFLTRHDWWRSHPFSISAAPNGEYLRITVKALGDFTTRLQDVRVGTRVFVEGPYGTLTSARRTKRRVLLIAGGVGITPLRALFEELPAKAGELTLVYRASHPDDLALRGELDSLAALRGHKVHYLVGRRGTREMPKDPLGPAGIASIASDVRLRDVYLCGPAPMMATVVASLERLGVPDSQIHLERFAF